MKKKIVCVLFILSMASALLSGCNGNGGSGESAGGGEGGGSASVSDEKVTITLGLPQNANVTSYDDNALTKYLEESLNVDLEFVYFAGTSAEYSQQLTLMASGREKLPDVLWGFDGLDHYAMNEFGEDGYFRDLTDLLKNYGHYYWEQFNKLPESDQKDITNKGTNTHTGAFYGMPMLTLMAMDNLQNNMYINQKWLNKLGLKAPANVDELYDVLKAFATKDPNGNGVADEIPLLSKAGGAQDISAYIINAFVHYDTLNPFNVKNGKLWDPVSTGEYRSALIYANKLCSEKLLSELSYSLSSTSEFVSLITPADGIAKVGLWCGHPAVWSSPSTTLLKEYTAIPALSDKTGLGGYTVIRPNTLSYCSYITKDCKYPERAMQLLDFFYKDETVTRVRHGEKEVDWVYDEKGGLNGNGTNSTIKRLGSDAAFFSGNRTWCRNGNSIMTDANYLTIITGSEGRQAEVDRLYTESWNYQLIGKSPGELAVRLVYTDKEYEYRTGYADLYAEYVLESRNLFITGSKNPNDDSQWNEYLTTLKSIGQAELLKIAQDAYTRSISP
ncbi:MAG: extracellular solute-binding protein [Oscillospiraceae bacterium]|nr:extracellular solute-binding protein [Oscillospiraceae bacterium]